MAGRTGQDGAIVQAVDDIPRALPRDRVVDAGSVADGNRCGKRGILVYQFAASPRGICVIVTESNGVRNFERSRNHIGLRHHRPGRVYGDGTVVATHAESAGAYERILLKCEVLVERRCPLIG